jgi:hypothetical protein
VGGQQSRHGTGAATGVENAGMTGLSEATEVSRHTSQDGLAFKPVALVRAVENIVGCLTGHANLQSATSQPVEPQLGRNSGDPASPRGQILAPKQLDDLLETILRVANWLADLR